MKLPTLLKPRRNQAKTVLIVVPTIMLLSLVSCLKPNTSSNSYRATLESISGSAEDRQAIEKAYQNWYTGWETKDYELAAQDYSDDAIWVNAFGMRRVGREAIEETLKRVFGMDFVMAGTSKTVEKTVNFFSPAVALVTSLVERSGQQTASGESMPTRQTSHLRVFVKSGGEWEIVSHLISDARNKKKSEL